MRPETERALVGKNFPRIDIPAKTDGSAVYGVDVKLDGMLQMVEDAFSSVTSSAAALGSVSSRIEMQNEFISKLTDSLDRGIGRLVDADMEEESARLSALQVQQQLGVQALSIANSNAQNILTLFRQ